MVARKRVLYSESPRGEAPEPFTDTSVGVAGLRETPVGRPVGGIDGEVVEAKTPVAVSRTGGVMIVLEASVSVRVSRGVDAGVAVSFVGRVIIELQTSVSVGVSHGVDVVVAVSPAGRVIGVPVISVSVGVAQGVDAVYVVIVIPGDGPVVDPIP